MSAVHRTSPSTPPLQVARISIVSRIADSLQSFHAMVVQIGIPVIQQSYDWSEDRVEIAPGHWSATGNLVPFATGSSEIRLYT